MIKFIICVTIALSLPLVIDKISDEFLKVTIMDIML